MPPRYCRDGHGVSREVEEMLQRVCIASGAVFVVWLVVDFAIHGVILRSAYAQTPAFWRPAGEMKLILAFATLLVAAVCFVGIFAHLVQPQTIGAGIRYGLLFGIGKGISLGYGSYAVMPIPEDMAFVWFVGALIEAVVGGIVAAIVLAPRKESNAS